MSAITCVADGAISAGRVVRIKGFSGGQIQVASATDATTATAHKNFGIAASAASGAGASLTVITPFVVAEATAGGVISAGALITTSAAGKVVAAAALDRAIGILLYGQSDDAATADGETCLVGLGVHYVDVT